MAKGSGGVRYAPLDPSLPAPWKGLIDGPREASTSGTLSPKSPSTTDPRSPWSRRRLERKRRKRKLEQMLLLLYLYLLLPIPMLPRLLLKAYRRQHEIAVLGTDVPLPFTTSESTCFPPGLIREVQVQTQWVDFVAAVQSRLQRTNSNTSAIMTNSDAGEGPDRSCQDRVGTGRAGATGTAFTFFCDQDGKYASDLVKVLEGAGQKVLSELRDMVGRGGYAARPRRWGGSNNGGGGNRGSGSTWGGGSSGGGDGSCGSTWGRSSGGGSNGGGSSWGASGGSSSGCSGSSGGNNGSMSFHDNSHSVLLCRLGMAEWSWNSYSAIPTQSWNSPLFLCRIALLKRCSVSSYNQVRCVFIKELGQPPENVFAEFNPVPLAGASLAQVHATHDGSKVAVKVQHTHLKDTALVDIATVEFMMDIFSVTIYFAVALPVSRPISISISSMVLESGSAMRCFPWL